MTSSSYDVAIVGGGPAGTTVGALLKKYAPELSVTIIERAKFPREHVGESQLPAIGAVLDEMGVWGKIEASNFIVKLGATYTWGKSSDPWVFSFIPEKEIGSDARPAPFDGWRKRVALQVDRAIYDEILLRHAQSLGVDVFEETAVDSVDHSDGEIHGLELSDGRIIKARHYVDASGGKGVLRTALDVNCDIPTLLKNVAFWDYWQAPGLNSDLLDRSTIRVQVRSVPYGWLWYIALSEDRASVGLVCPADYYAKQKQSPAEIYARGIADEHWISKKLAKATSTHEVRATKDWSFLADEAYGKNWFLCGESLGFADPILAAGLTLTHTCAQHCAYTILELERGEHDGAWLKEQYAEIQRKRVRQHMKFAEYWYSANGCFTDLQEFCSDVASSAGLKLSPEEAFRWLSNGGIDDQVGQSIFGGFDIPGFKQVQHRFEHKEAGKVEYALNGKNQFRLKLGGAEELQIATLHAGRVHPVKALRRGNYVLPLAGGYAIAVRALEQTHKGHEVVQSVRSQCAERFKRPEDLQFAFVQALNCLERMVVDGWVKAHYKHGQPALQLETPEEGDYIYSEAK